ncbi:hypothetical protein [Actinoplanes sp. NPDC051851]|uniref:hypothetical protein n=1 Tax=Actinoplanes sp. NPDC051851 TaxID=3154753 RepID=UPI00341CF907
MAQAATGFSITVPDNWFEIDVHPDTRNGAINTLVTERIAGMPELWEHRTAMVRALRRAARSAHASGAAYCGVMVEGFGGAVLTAGITVSIVDAPNGETGAPAVMRYLKAIPNRGDGTPWRQVEQADLPQVGPVARTRGLEDVVAPDGAGWIRSVLMQTFVPFPGPMSDRVALITGNSPIVQLEAELHDLFDAITSTFRFHTTS